MIQPMNNKALGAIRVSDSITTCDGMNGIVQEVCGLGVWITVRHPEKFSDFGNPIGVGWKSIASLNGDPIKKQCGNCQEFFAKHTCAVLSGHGECDCPKCQGYCECDHE